MTARIPVVAIKAGMTARIPVVAISRVMLDYQVVPLVGWKL